MSQKVIEDVREKSGDIFAREKILIEKEKRSEYDKNFVDKERIRLEKLRTEIENQQKFINEQI